MGHSLRRDERDLAKFAAECYYGITDGDYEIEVFDNFDNKMPNVGFISDIQKELGNWWTYNIGMKSKVARLSEIDFIHYINMLRAKNGSPPISTEGGLHKKWMKYVVSNNPHVYLVAIKCDETKLVLVNTKVVARSRI
jgi:hypothetical protein